MSEYIQIIAHYLGIDWLDRFHILLIMFVLFLLWVLLKRSKNYFSQQIGDVKKEITNSAKKIAQLYEASRDPSRDALLTRNTCLKCLQQIVESIEGLHVATGQTQDELLELTKKLSVALNTFQQESEKTRREIVDAIHEVVAMDMRKNDDLLGLVKLLIDRTTGISSSGQI